MKPSIFHLRQNALDLMLDRAEQFNQARLYRPRLYGTWAYNGCLYIPEDPLQLTLAVRADKIERKAASSRIFVG
jgi:hypothetical protein